MSRMVDYQLRKLETQESGRVRITVKVEGMICSLLLDAYSNRITRADLESHIEGQLPQWRKAHKNLTALFEARA